MKRLIFLLLILAAPIRATLPDADLSASEKVRFHHLCQKLIAPCCWTQTVDTHSSPATDQARMEVVALILDGKSDREILDSFISRYGERILAEPEGLKSVILTTVPIVSLFCGFVWLVWFLRSHRPRAVAAVSRAVADLIPDSDWE